MAKKAKPKAEPRTSKPTVEKPKAKSKVTVAPKEMEPKPVKKVECPNCKTVVAADTIFNCPSCPKSGCALCGWEKKGMEFCPSCGVEL